MVDQMEISHLRELQNHFEANRANTPEAQQSYKQSEELKKIGNPPVLVTHKKVTSISQAQK